MNGFHDDSPTGRDGNTGHDPSRLQQQRETWLHAIRRRVKKPPRHLGMGTWFGPWAVPRPPWLKASDPLQLFYKERKELLRRGFVTWGAVVQANQLAFTKETIDVPGEVVYGIDPEDTPDPTWLINVASDLYALKGVPDLDPELAPIGDYLAGETARAFGRLVPRSFVREHQVAISTVLFFRRHLPGRHLRSRLLPLLVADDTPRVAMTVPSRFWPRDMRAAWNRDEL